MTNYSYPLWGQNRCKRWSMSWAPIASFRKFLNSLFTVVVWGPFEKFVDSRYNSESELCRGAVTVSFSKYVPWQAMNFLQRSTHFSKMCCRPFAKSFRRIVEQTVLTFDYFEVSKFLLKRFHHLKTVARLITSSLQAWWMSCRVSYPLFPSRKQNSLAQRWRCAKEIPAPPS
jgi:hypothetical protein